MLYLFLETDFVQWYSYDKTKTCTYSNKTHADSLGRQAVTLYNRMEKE